MSWFKNVWSGGLGALTFAAAVVVTPIVSVYNGVEEMMEDNPQGVSNWGQFKEGASFGLIDAKDGLTPESTADAVYDSGKSVGEGALRFGDRLLERASDDLEGVSDQFKDVSVSADSIFQTETQTNRFLDPNADYSLPEDTPEPNQ